MDRHHIKYYYADIENKALLHLTDRALGQASNAIELYDSINSVLQAVDNFEKPFDTDYETWKKEMGFSK